LEGIEPHGGHRVDLPVVANENVDGVFAKFGVTQDGSGVLYWHGCD
jgi:hypothetical protein